jgi:hypothetical protein
MKYKTTSETWAETYKTIDLDYNAEAYAELKASVPCLAKAQRDFAAGYGTWPALADLLHGDVRAYLLASAEAELRYPG